MKGSWVKKKLGEIAKDFYRGSGIRRDQITASGYPCIRYGEIYTTYNIAFENHDEAEKRNNECGYTEICMDAGDEVFKSRQVD